jgi:hypothetical protein
LSAFIGILIEQHAWRAARVAGAAAGRGGEHHRTRSAIRY